MCLGQEGIFDILTKLFFMDHLTPFKMTDNKKLYAY